MDDYKAGKFCKRIPLHATPQQVYDAWTKQENLEKWFLRQASFTGTDGKPRQPSEPVQKGDLYHWLWHGYGDDTYEKHEVFEANGKDCFRFGFSGDCIVSIFIKQEVGETICELWQENIPPVDDPGTSLFMLCGEGWTFYLANLKSILEGGIDLRNKNEQIKRVINS